jgi:aminoglycoside phosphotransferase (APT) family kinase protein
MSARSTARAEKKNLLMQRAAKFQNEAFVAQQLIPIVPEVAHAADQPSCMSDVVRAKGTGRITLRYDFNGSVTIYAKVYTDSLGLHSYSALRSLWMDGFGRTASLRVPEPLGFIAEENFLVMRQAEGVPLAELLFDGTPDEVLIKATQAAARWLAQLHACRLPSIQIEPACERIKIFKLADMLAKASAAYPEQATLLLDFLQKIRTLAPDESSTRLVPTHGQYTPANVFLHGDHTAVIDLDRICLSDPAKDVAMFVHRIKSLLFKDGNDMAKAQLIASKFLDEYSKHAPENLSNLPYYTALYSLKGFAKIAKDRGPADPLRRPLEEFYMGTFEHCMKSAKASAFVPAAATANLKGNGSSKEDLGKWAGSFTKSDFIGQFVYPQLGGTSSSRGEVLACDATIVQNTGTGRLTLRYDFDLGETIYAKLYTDELGTHSYQVLKELWDGGFNSKSRFQVPEPLGFFPEYNLVLMRGVLGRPLVEALNGEGPLDLIEGCRDAARWLAAFHRSSIRVGEPEPDWDSLKIFRVCVRLLKAAAAQPEHRDALLDFMHALKSRAQGLPEKRFVAQTHGRYHHEHVFINGNEVAVIDLDRSRPTDPAKDVAEFLRVLRMSAFRSHPDMKRADEATKAFLDEYFSQLPEVAASLPYYWSAFLWLSLFGFMKKLGNEDPRRPALLDFHLQEMERAMRAGA